MKCLSGRPRVVLVTVRVPLKWQNSVNDALRYAQRRYKNTVIADWYAVSGGARAAVDGAHTTPKGARLYAKTIAAKGPLSPPGMPRRGALAAAVALALVLTGLLGTATRASAAPRVTVIGDSVQASFEFAPQAGRLLGRRLDLRMEARVCRRLVTASCAFMGDTPETALELARRLGPALGDAVVINVGYNDYRSVYRIDAALGALRAAGVRSVGRVTLREDRSEYPPINDAIRRPRAGRRWSGWPTDGGPAPDGPGSRSTTCTSTPPGRSRWRGCCARTCWRALPRPGSRSGRPRHAQRVGAADRSPGDPHRGRRADALDRRCRTTRGARRRRTGRRLGPSAPIGADYYATSDGRQAWLRVGAPTEIARPAVGAPALKGRVLGRFAAPPLLARARGWLWAAAPGSLEGVEPRTGRRQAIATTMPAVRGVAASPGALAAVARAPRRPRRAPDGGAARPGHGALVRTILLPGTTSPRAIAATEAAAWGPRGRRRAARGAPRGGRDPRPRSRPGRHRRLPRRAVDPPGRPADRPEPRPGDRPGPRPRPEHPAALRRGGPDGAHPRPSLDRGVPRRTLRGSPVREHRAVADRPGGPVDRRGRGAPRRRRARRALPARHAGHGDRRYRRGRGLARARPGPGRALPVRLPPRRRPRGDRLQQPPATPA